MGFSKQKLLDWLSKPKNLLELLKLFGRCLVVLGAAVWGLYTYFHAKKTPSLTTQIIQQHATEGNIAIIQTAPGNVKVGVPLDKPKSRVITITG